MTRKAKKSPAFQFYPSNFLGSPKVRAMSLAEIGLYTLALCLDWDGVGFTADELHDLAATQREGVDFNTAWGRVSRCFEHDGERFYSARLKSERQKQREWRRKSSKGGKIGAAKRWGRQDKGAVGVVTPNDDTLFVSLSPTPKQQTPATDAVFVEAWAVYPKRPGSSRADSYKQWIRRVKEGVDPLDMLEGTRRYARFVDAEGTEPRYRKQAQTFYGPGKHFENDWTPSQPADSLSQRVAELIADEDAALAKTAELLRSRGVA